MRHPIRRPRRNLERHEETMADRFMQTLGFTAIRFSQPRATMQTAGIPDRRYYHPGLGVALWYECKAPGGKQSPGQREFQRLCAAVGDPYVVGPALTLMHHCRDQGWAVQLAPGLYQPSPQVQLLLRQADLAAREGARRGSLGKAAPPARRRGLGGGGTTPPPRGASPDS